MVLEAAMYWTAASYISLELSAKFTYSVLVCKEVWGELQIWGEGRAQEDIPGFEPGG